LGRGAFQVQQVARVQAEPRGDRGQVDPMAVEELASLREELRLARATMSVATASRPFKCLTCGRAHLIWACAACLGGSGARPERRTVDGAEEVRFVIESADAKSFVSEWTPTLSSMPQSGS
jgi:hypothetical protein